jgi:hypothetical protein
VISVQTIVLSLESLQIRRNHNCLKSLSFFFSPALRDVTNYLADEPGIKAILVGGGCNDLVSGLPGQTPLYRMLKPLGEGDDPLDEGEVSSFIDGTLSK